MEWSQEPVGEPHLASSGPFSAWLHPAASTIQPTSPASPSLPGEKMARSRADAGIVRQAPRIQEGTECISQHTRLPRKFCESLYLSVDRDAVARFEKLLPVHAGPRFARGDPRAEDIGVCNGHRFGKRTNPFRSSGAFLGGGS